MKNAHAGSRERGQATMEIAVAAVAIIFLVIGFFTLGSIGVVSIKSLLLTRYQAENSAQASTSGSSSTSNQIASWDYTSFQDVRTNEKFTVPFLAGDEAAKSNTYAGINYLDDETWSLSNNPDRAQSTEETEYVFLPYRDTPAIPVQSSVYTGNSLVLSMIHTKKAVLPDGMKENGAFDLKFKDGWIDASKIDVTRWPSSSFSFPAFGPRR